MAKISNLSGSQIRNMLANHTNGVMVASDGDAYLEAVHYEASLDQSDTLDENIFNVYVGI